MEKISKFVQGVLNEKINEMQDSGLFLLDLYTGSGKTYNIIKYSIENFKNKKIFFVSNQLKNLPSEKEFIKQIIESKSDAVSVVEFQNTFLRIYSILDGYIKFISMSNYQEYFVDSEIGVERFENIFKIVKSIQNSNSTDSIEYFMNKFKDEESKLRSDFKKDLSSMNEEEVENEKKWINLLYPASLIFEKNIILLSTKKFYNYIDPIIAPAFYLSNSEEFKGSIIFFDEVDKVKDDLLDLICNNHNTTTDIDIFKLFRQIFNVMKNPRFNAETIFDALELDVKVTEEMLEKFNVQITRLRELKIQYQELYNNIEYSFYYKEKLKSTFLFKTKQTNTIIKTDSNQKAIDHEIIFHNDKDLENNRVEIVKVIELNENDKKVKKYLNEAIIAVKRFIFIIMSIGDKYYEYNKKYSKEKLSRVECVNSLLDRIDLSTEYKKFIFNQINLSTKNDNLDVIKETKHNRRDKRYKRYDFYYDGFSFVNVQNKKSENLETKFFINMFNTTPEVMFLDTINNFKVVGVSATGTIRTSLKNFDLNFLDFVSSNKILYLNQVELTDFLLLTKQAQKQYPIEISVSKDVNIELKRKIKYFLNTEFDWKRDQGRIDAYDMLVKEEYDNIEEKISLKYSYKFNDIYQIIFQIIKMIREDRIHSFIYFLNYGINIIHLDFIKAFIKKQYNINEGLFIERIDKYSFDEDYNLKDASNFYKYEKVFLITTYQTAGVGVNLKYTYNSLEKDIDACYLSKVSNILPRPEIGVDNISKSLFGIMYLKTNDSISKQNADYNIKNILLNHRMSLHNYVNYKDICLGVSSILIQAVGRICRNTKDKEYSYIALDKGNESYLSVIKDNLKSNVFSREFEAVLNKVAIGKKEDLKHITTANKYTYKTIKEVLCRPMTEESVIRWKEIRRIALTYPTVDNVNILEENKNFYFKHDKEIKHYSVNKYNFTTDLSLECNEFSENCNGISSNRLSISQGSANLYAISQIEEVREHFKKNNFSLDFKENNFIMCSEFFKSIYKGALGEEFGKVIFKKFGLDLIEINNPDVFEFFDYRYGDYYFDFKFWHESMTKVELSELKKISRKAKAVNAKKVYIINIFYEGYEDTPEEGYEYVVDEVKICTISWIYNKITKKFNDIAITSLCAEVLTVNF